MDNLTLLQTILIGFIFIWSGFVRSGLGFGSAVLSLPVLLFILHDPLYFIPILAVQTWFFTFITVVRPYLSGAGKSRTDIDSEGRNAPQVNWSVLKIVLAIIIVPKLTGVLGLVSLPTYVVRLIIFGVVAAYALSYLINRPLISINKKMDAGFLVIGGYIHGTSLMGSPLLVAVISKYVQKSQLRDTLFMLWFFLIIIKIIALLYFKVDFHITQQLWLLPCAGLGHLLGLKWHSYLQLKDTKSFYRILGGVLLVVSILGLYGSVGHFG